jgi:hypothetical protein
MKTTQKQLGDDKPVIPEAEWKKILDQCYEIYCLARARKAAESQECPKLHNMLVQLHNFSSVVEAKRSTKAGDVGWLIIVWKK